MNFCGRTFTEIITSVKVSTHRLIFAAYSPASPEGSNLKLGAQVGELVVGQCLAFSMGGLVYVQRALLASGLTC